jgi:ABC-2 type transport system permease protein
MRNLLGRLFARNRGFLIASALVIGGFQFILCAIVVTMNLESTLEQIRTFAPPLFRAMIEQTMLGGSAAGVLAFGWNHPITQAVMTAVAITLGARAVAGEIEIGAIELVLAQPLSRTAYLAAHLIFGVSAIALVALAGTLGMMVGQRVLGLEPFGAGRVAALVVNLILLQAALYALTLLVSAWGREAGRVAVIGVLVAVVSYLINVIATFWPKAAFTLPWSLHSYYNPRAILVDGALPAVHVLALAGVAVACFAIAFRRFATRDLP